MIMKQLAKSTANLLTATVAAGALLSPDVAYASPEDRATSIKNDVAATFYLGGLSTNLLVRLNEDPAFYFSGTPIESPLKDRSESWAKFDTTVITSESACSISAVARVNRNGTLGGWSENVVAPITAVSEVKLQDDQGQIVHIVTPPEDAGNNSKRASLTLGIKEGDHLETHTYVAAPEDAERQLGLNTMTAAQNTFQGILDKCGVYRVQ